MVLTTGIAFPTVYGPLLSIPRTLQRDKQKNGPRIWFERGFCGVMSQVGSQSVSPLLVSIESGNLEAAKERHLFMAGMDATCVVTSFLVVKCQVSNRVLINNGNGGCSAVGLIQLLCSFFELLKPPGVEEACTNKG